MVIEHLWIGTDKGNPQRSEKSLFWYYFVDPKSHINYPRFEPWFSMVSRWLLTAGENDWMTESWDAGRGRCFRACRQVSSDCSEHYYSGGKEAGSWKIFAINCHHAQNKACKWTSVPLHLLVNVKKWRLGSSVSSTLSANLLISSLDKRSHILLRFNQR